MAREKMITRTMVTTHAKILAVDTTTDEVVNLEVDLPRVYKDEKTLNKVARKAVETDTIKFVAVKSTTTSETLYGMSEIEFIKLAQILPSRPKPETSKKK